MARPLHTYLVCIMEQPPILFGEDFVPAMREVSQFMIRAPGDLTAHRIIHEILPPYTQTETYRVVNGVVSRYSTRELARQRRAQYGGGRRY
jgi:hypothetical protein